MYTYTVLEYRYKTKQVFQTTVLNKIVELIQTYKVEEESDVWLHQQ